MFTRKHLASAICLGLLSSSGFSDVAIAQNNVEKDIEKIAVTGSRIKRTDMETATPVTVFSADDILKSGLSTLSEFLRYSTVGGAGTATESATLSQVAGSSSVDAKSFGSQYTLVLLNGRRLPINAISSDFIDINQIPMAAVERLEYLADGASAIYGSDAIAGVVNIITKKDFEGIDVTLSYGTNVKEHDGDEITAQVVAGAGNDKTNIMLAIDYFERKPVSSQARGDQFKTALLDIDHPNGDSRSGSGFPGWLLVTGNSPFITQLGVPFPDCPTRDTVSIGNGSICMYDFAADYQFVPASDRQSIMTTVNHKLTDDIDLYGEFRYSRAYTLTSNAAAPGRVDVTGSPYLLSFLATIYGADGAADIVANPTTRVRMQRRFLEFGNREKDNTNETFSSVIGAKGIWADDYDWDFSLGHIKLTNRQIGRGGQVLRSQIEKAFSNGSLNPFVLNKFDTPEKQAARDAILSSIHRTGESKLNFANFIVSGETGLELGGGELAFATGFDWRKETFLDRSDTASITGDVIGGAGSNGGGGRTTSAVYLELSAPVTDNIEVNAAVRHDSIDWNIDAASKTTGQISMSWRPTDDLLLRASAGTGFKAPDLHQLFLGSSFGVNQATDTKRCNDIGGGDPNHPDCNDTEIRSRTGGNPALQPEESNNYNVGIAWDITETASLTLDYWSLKVEGIVGTLGIQEILDNEAKFPELIKRVDGSLTDPTAFVLSNFQNLTEESAKGITIDYQQFWDTDAGRFGVGIHADTQLEHLRQSSAIQPLCDDVGSTSEPEWKGTLNLDWRQNQWSSNIYVRYSGKTEDYAGGRVSGSCAYKNKAWKVDDYVQVDWRVGYTFENSSQLTVGLRNIFDQDPPLTVTGARGGLPWPFYDSGLYDNMGRYIYARYNISF